MNEVVLVPGLWMPAAAMALIALRLSRAGYRAIRFAYPGRQPLEANIERFARFVRREFGERAVHFVGHSLGGVLIYEMLQQHREVAAGRVVLLGAPVGGCLAGRRLGERAWGRKLLGGCAPRWESREASWTRVEPLGVVAGSLPVGLGPILGRLPGANDGVVCVDETRILGMRERVLVREAHSWLPFSGRVGTLVECFLRTGRFS